MVNIRAADLVVDEPHPRRSDNMNGKGSLACVLWPCPFRSLASSSFRLRVPAEAMNMFPCR